MINSFRKRALKCLVAGITLITFIAVVRLIKPKANESKASNDTASVSTAAATEVTSKVSNSDTQIVTQTPTLTPISTNSTDNWTKTTTNQSSNLLYVNNQYSFKFSLPDSWKGYKIISDTWKGLDFSENDQKVVETGPIISIRHPKWTNEIPRQDIPIMVFTLDQWNLLQQEKFHIGAAPIGPSELGRNNKYVFALPARYNFSNLKGIEEVADILKGNPLQGFNNN